MSPSPTRPGSPRRASWSSSRTPGAAGLPTATSTRSATKPPTAPPPSNGPRLCPAATAAWSATASPTRAWSSCSPPPGGRAAWSASAPRSPLRQARDGWAYQAGRCPGSPWNGPSSSRSTAPGGRGPRLVPAAAPPAGQRGRLELGPRRGRCGAEILRAGSRTGASPGGDWNVGVRYADIGVPALHTGGWWDRFARGHHRELPRAARGRRRTPAARHAQRLVMGPWRHMPWSPVPEPGPSGQDVADLHLQWWRQLLYGEPAPLLREPVRAWVTGLGWRTYAPGRRDDGRHPVVPRLRRAGPRPASATARSAAPPSRRTSRQTCCRMTRGWRWPRAGGHGCCLAGRDPDGPGLPVRGRGVADRAGLHQRPAAGPRAAGWRRDRADLDVGRRAVGRRLRAAVRGGRGRLLGEPP